MKSKQIALILIAVLLVLAAIFGVYYFKNRDAKPTATHAADSEQPVKLIPLAGAVADASAELSGTAWHGDSLILLPQYPERFGEGDGMLFALPKQDILNNLDGKSTEPLTPTEITLVASGLKESIPNFQGYEAIGFHGDQVFMTIEAGDGTDMRGYLVSGVLSGNEIKLDTAKVVEIPLPIASENHTDEAMIVTEDQILTFYELNGAGLVAKPEAQVFDFELNPQPGISFPQIEYRVTDAALDSDGQVWVINYFYPGDTDMLPKVDPLAQTYGEGATHAQYDHVERLVKLSYSNSGITLTDAAPIQISLEKDNARNWEGLVLLDQRGFLMVTDKFPGTLLGFVEMP
jgi:hypothetical protein